MSTLALFVQVHGAPGLRELQFAGEMWLCGGTVYFELRVETTARPIDLADIGAHVA